MHCVSCSYDEVSIKDDAIIAAIICYVMITVVMFNGYDLDNFSVLMIENAFS